MKKSFLSSIILLALSALLFSSCEKDDDAMIVPNIAFQTVAGYTSTDATVGTNANILIGITASKAEANDVLTLYTVTRSYDGGGASQIYSETLSGTSGDNYSKVNAIVTRSTPGKEKYTFTVSNKDGLTNSVSLTLTVQ
jgi:hypothetical protein